MQNEQDTNSHRAKTYLEREQKKGTGNEWKKVEKKGKQGKDRADKAGERIKRIRRGLGALKEIQKYQSSTEMLIRRLLFQRVIKEIVRGKGGIYNYN